MNPAVNIAINAARKAGRIINIASNDLDSIRIEKKGPNDFVSEIDRKAEAAIIETIREAYPHHGFLAEESGVSKPDKPDKTHGKGSGNFQWIIDPLDGTTNFLHGFPQYAVSIALYQDDKPQAGVIYDPNRNEIFSAAKGEGAYMDNRRLRVTQSGLSGALVATGFPYKNIDYVKQYLAQMELIMSNTAGLRRPGAASLDLAYIAAGRFDAFWEYNLSPWDYAAGVILIREAGGIVTNVNGKMADIHCSDLLCANPKLHEQILNLFNPKK